MTQTTSTQPASLADRFLEDLRDAGTPVSVYLVSGFQLKGEIVVFDDSAILFNHRGTHQMVMRSAVANIYPFSNSRGESWWKRYLPDGAGDPAAS